MLFDCLSRAHRCPLPTLDTRDACDVKLYSSSHNLLGARHHFPIDVCFLSFATRYLYE